MLFDSKNGSRMDHAASPGLIILLICLNQAMFGVSFVDISVGRLQDVAREYTHVSTYDLDLHVSMVEIRLFF
jgi:hypothetical protein